MIVTNAEIDAALQRELISGRKFKEATLRARERAAAQDSAQAKGHKAIPGLGKLVASIPADEYFALIQKYGYDCFDDRGFVRDFQRLEPDLACHKV